MAKAGFCDQCQANVWLLDGGGCQNGHAASSISSPYEVDSVSIAPCTDEALIAARKQIRALAIVGALGLSLLLAGSVFAAALAMRSGGSLSDLKGSTPPTADWKARLAMDYPGWKVVDFSSSVIPGTGDPPEKDYFVDLVPAGRDFTVGLTYTSRNGGWPQADDDVLRAGGLSNEQAPALLDYLQHNYADRGKSIDIVTSDSAGDAEVTWSREASAIGDADGVDELVYDEASGTWKLSP